MMSFLIPDNFEIFTRQKVTVAAEIPRYMKAAVKISQKCDIEKL